MNRSIRTALMILMVLVAPLLLAEVGATEPPRMWVLIVCGSTGPSFHCDTTYMYHIITHHTRYDGIDYLSTATSDIGVNQTATKDQVRLAINTTLASWSTESDIVFIFFASHGVGYNTVDDRIEDGRYNGTQGDISDPNDENQNSELRNGTGWVGVDEGIQIGNMPDDQIYWDDELKNDLGYVHGNIIFVIQGCFSGGLIDDLSIYGSNRIIISASNETYYSKGSTDPPGPGFGFSEFSERFCDALNGKRASYDATQPEDIFEYSPSSYPVNADFNGDGHVSIGETWNYSLANDEARIAGQENPWFDDDGDKLPTFKFGVDYNDTDQGANMYQTFLPIQVDLAVEELDPIEHYPIFQIFNGSMYYNTNPSQHNEVRMRYSVTIKRKDSNDPPGIVYANVSLKRTSKDDPSNFHTITTIANQNFAPGQTRIFELEWNESQTQRLSKQPVRQFWNISCVVEAITPGLFEVDIANNELQNDTVEGRYLPGDATGNGEVEIYDAIRVATCFGTSRGQPEYNETANFNLDEKINIFDAILLSNNFGRTIFDMRGVSGAGAMIQPDGARALFENPTMTVEPSDISVFKDESFDVDVRVNDVLDLYGWEFKLYWNSTLLNCTDAQVSIPAIWENTTFEYGSGLENSYNDSSGRYFKALTPTDPAPSFNGSMTIAKLTFKALQPGTTSLALTETELGNREADSIDHTELGGSVTVYYDRYMRSDTATVNGLNAYVLNATETTSYTYVQQLGQGDGAQFGIRAWVRASNGTEYEVTLDGQTGTPKAVVTDTGWGTVNVTQKTMQTTFSFVIRVYVRIEGGAWTNKATFTTEQLGKTSLQGTTWSVYYCVSVSYNARLDRTTARFYWGDASHMSRIQNLQFS
jgi:hypothetical protein